MEEAEITRLQGEVHCLLLQSGNKWDESSGRGAVASLAFGRRSSCLVFVPPLPKGRKPEGRVRMCIRALRDPSGQPRLDRSGQPLFQGSPASVMYEDRWRDNGDGTASRVTYAIDWLLTEREEGVNETRVLATKDEPSEKTPEYHAEWGVDLVTTNVVKVRYPVTIHYRETVVIQAAEHGSPGGTMIQFQRTGETPGVPFVDRCWKVEELRVLSQGVDFFASVYPTDRIFRLNLRTDGAMDDRREQLELYETWGKLPLWVQLYITTEYFPLCACGRQRYVARQQDGYVRCELCRDEETCDRCGCDPRRIKLVSGRRVCPACESMAGFEALAQTVSSETRVRVVTAAQRLLTGKAMAGELAEMILASTMDHFDRDTSTRDRLLQKWSGYAWYYFCDDGVYASKFSPEALQLLRHYDRATGDGLVIMTAWIASGERTIAQCERGDFYWSTQVKGQSIQLVLTASQCTGEYALAVRLRGAEQDRQTALTRFRTLTAAFGDGSDEAWKVRGILIGDDQDYRVAIAALDELDQVLRLRAEGDARVARAQEAIMEILRRDYASCPFCGVSWDWSTVDQTELRYTPCHCSDDHASLEKTERGGRFCHAVQAGMEMQTASVERRTSAVLLRETVIGEVPVLQMVLFDKYGRWNLCIACHAAAFREIGKAVTCEVWHEPTDREIRLAAVRRDMETYADACAAAEQLFSNGEVHKLRFHPGKKPSTGEFQWQARDGSVKYVCDRNPTVTVREGPFYYCREVRILAEHGDARIVLVSPYLEAGRDLASELAAAEAGREYVSEPVQPQPKSGAIMPGHKAAATAEDVSAKIGNLFGGGAKARKRR